MCLTHCIGVCVSRQALASGDETSWSVGDPETRTTSGPGEMPTKRLASWSDAVTALYSQAVMMFGLGRHAKEEAEKEREVQEIAAEVVVEREMERERHEEEQELEEAKAIRQANLSPPIMTGDVPPPLQMLTRSSTRKVKMTRTILSCPERGKVVLTKLIDGVGLCVLRDVGSAWTLTQIETYADEPEGSWTSCHLQLLR